MVVTRRLLVYGASGHGRVVAEAATAAGWEVVGWADDDRDRRRAMVSGFPVLATGSAEVSRIATERGSAVAVAVGDNAARRRLSESLREEGVELARIVHPSAVVSPSASIGAGTVVLAGAVVGVGAAIGDGVIVNTAATVDHDCRLGSWVHLSPGVHLGGTVRVGEGTRLGVGAVVSNDLSIGAWSVIGVGAAVVRSMEDRVVAYGVPARVIRRIGT